MLKTFKYRLYPTKPQQKALNSALRDCCWLYNQMLEQRKTAYETDKTSIRCFDQINQIPVLKNTTRPSLKLVHSQVLQNVAQRLDLGMQAFFRRTKRGEKPGYPRFRPFQRYDSITFPQVPSGCKLTLDGFLALSKIGNVPVILHRPLEGTPKSAVVRRTSTGKWFVSFSCEWQPTQLAPKSNEIGIDMGIKTFAALSDGDRIENPKFFKAEQKALARANQKLAKQTKGTPLRKKAKRAVSRTHERVAWRRENFAQQQSRRLVNNFGTLIAEDLSIKDMVENGLGHRSLNKAIADAAWRQFLSLIACKAEWAGRQFATVNPAWTSQTCSTCGNPETLGLSSRVFRCSVCKLELDRDTNAAKNILALGTQCAGASLRSHRL